VETRLGGSSDGRVGAAAEVVIADGALHVSCGGGGVLKVPAVLHDMTVLDASVSVL
jgi:hypothetical protein